MTQSRTAEDRWSRRSREEGEGSTWKTEPWKVGRVEAPVLGSQGAGICVVRAGARGQCGL